MLLLSSPYSFKTLILSKAEINPFWSLLKKYNLKIHLGSPYEVEGCLTSIEKVNSFSDESGVLF